MNSDEVTGLSRQRLLRENRQLLSMVPESEHSDYFIRQATINVLRVAMSLEYDAD